MNSPIPLRPFALVKTADAAIFLCPTQIFPGHVNVDDGDPYTDEPLRLELSPDEWRVLAPFIMTYLAPRTDRVSSDRGPNGEEVIRLPIEEGFAIDTFVSTFIFNADDVDLRYVEARARQWFTHYVHLGEDGLDAFIADQPAL